MTEQAVYHDIHTARLIDGLTDLQRDIHELAIEKGWWDEPRNDGELLALIHSEVSEILEALRHGNPRDQHCPEFSSAEIELSDVVIRCLDMAQARGWKVAEAIVAKHAFNRSREYRHGGKAF
jgi:NTP pyrophosphatase (non-canonical NTP hydrolase)